MKSFLVIIIILFTTFLSCLAAGPTQPTLVFAWDNPTTDNYINLTYRIYYTTNITTPINQWPLLTVVTNMVLVGNQLYSTNTLPLSPGVYFFTMTSSNSWYGVPVESFFSQAASNRPPPPVLNNLLLLPPR